MKKGRICTSTTIIYAQGYKNYMCARTRVACVRSNKSCARTRVTYVLKEELYVHTNKEQQHTSGGISNVWVKNNTNFSRIFFSLLLFHTVFAAIKNASSKQMVVSRVG